MHAPERVVIRILIDAAIGPGRHRALDEAVRVIDEHLDPDRARSQGSRVKDVAGPQPTSAGRQQRPARTAAIDHTAPVVRIEGQVAVQVGSGVFATERGLPNS